MATSRLLKIVETYVHYTEMDQTSTALWRTANEFGCSKVDVAEAVFPYLSSKQRDHILALRNSLFGAKFIYSCRVRPGIPASRMMRYTRVVA